MRSTIHLGRGPIGAALFVGLIPLVHAREAAVRLDGWSMQYTTTIATTGGVEQPTSGSLGSGRMRFAGSRSRVDQLTGLAMMFTGPDGYIISDLESGVANIVNPSAKTYMVMDAKAMGGMANAMTGALESVGATITVENAKVDVVDLGAGGVIAGHATKHVRVRRSWTTRTRVMGMSHAEADSTDDEYWMATDLGEELSLVRYQRALVQQWSASASSGKVLETLAEAMWARMPKGFPVRQKSVQHVGDGAAVSTVTTTNEITSIARTTIDPSIFDVPSSYERTEFMGAKPDTAGAARRSR